jgi:hypothetical protein
LVPNTYSPKFGMVHVNPSDKKSSQSTLNHGNTSRNYEQFVRIWLPTIFMTIVFQNMGTEDDKCVSKHGDAKYTLLFVGLGPRAIVKTRK